MNVSISLREKAKRWYEVELSDSDRSTLSNPTNGIGAWTMCLIQRFKQSATVILEKLNKLLYGRIDASARKDPVDFLYKVIGLTRHKPT